MAWVSVFPHHVRTESTTLIDGFVEQTLSRWHGHQGIHLGTTAGLTKDGYVVGIAAKVGNVGF